MDYTTPQPKQSSVMPEGENPTISAKPIYPEVVVGPIRRRFRSSQAVWYVLGVIEVFLAIRFFLKLIGANESAGFTRFLYTISYPFAGPFINVVNFTQVDKSIFEWSMLLGMAIYALIAWGVVKLLVMSKPVSDSEAHTKLDSQE